MFLQIRQLDVCLIFLVPLDTQAGTNCQIFSLETRASGRSRKKKSNFAGFSGTDSWKKLPILWEFLRPVSLKNN